LSGKCLNSGQTCIAPDYVLISKAREKEFIDTCMTKLAKRYPTLVDNEDITWIVNDRHFHRINALIDDAVAKGAVKHQFN
ncbi:aldehyde dehydrogenase family protein, partial [Flavonifractor plautii]|uniref:aldehyde dehydrogenase family protein n=1 Tax=Flavonifractor plautii TaxID=292800 RepID=UPI003D7EA256